LEELAGKFDLFLDGAIEACNDRALDTGDVLLFGGEDPVSIDPGRVQRLLV
jgi:hypothetical protein